MVKSKLTLGHNLQNIQTACFRIVESRLFGVKTSTEGFEPPDTQDRNLVLYPTELRALKLSYSSIDCSHRGTG